MKKVFTLLAWMFVCSSWSAQYWVTTLNDGASENTDIQSILSDGSGGVYVGGSFSSIDGLSSINGSSVHNIARWNGSWTSALAGGRPNVVRALALSGTTLYAGGEAVFTGDYFSSWNGSSWTSINGLSGVEGYEFTPPIAALLSVGGTLYVGGHFTSPSTDVATYSGGSWSALPNLRPGSLPHAPQSIAKTDNGNIFVLYADGSSYSTLWKYTGSGSWISITLPETQGPPEVPESECCVSSPTAIAAKGNDLYVAGIFGDQQPGSPGGDLPGYSGIARYDAVNGTWSGLSSLPWTVALDGTGHFAYGPSIQTLAFAGNDLYVGGKVTFNGSASAYLYKFDGSSWTSYGGLAVSGSDVVVSLIGVSGEDVYVAGNFTTADSVNVHGFAKLETTRVSIAAPDSIAHEPEYGSPDNATFRISRTGPTTTALPVHFATSGSAVSGVDYESIGTSATIPVGASYVEVTVTAKDDPWYEGSESVVVTVSAAAGYVVDSSGSQATIAITDFRDGEDNDGDGMRDGWEVFYFGLAYATDPNSPVGSADPDSDGATNVQESEQASNPFDSDSDGDGVQDGLEHAYGMNPWSVDTDGDGVNDYDEFSHGSSPTSPDTDSDGISDYDEIFVWGSAVAGADSDGDYLPDGYELTYWGHPTNGSGSDGWTDSDGDGYDNYSEYLAGTDPTDANSHP